jgi:predicted alpha/beta hydrolase
MPDSVISTGAPTGVARESFSVTAPDGVAHTALEFAAASTGPIFVVLPAMGVPATYYEPFALQLAQRMRATVVLCDLRGQGSSTAHARAGADFGYREILELDFPALFAALALRHADRPLVLIGHSLGGQLATIYAGHLPPAVKGLVLVAAGTAHTAAWRGFDRLLVVAYTSLIRAAGAVLPWYPGRVLGFGSEHPKRLIRDWGRVVATGRYLPEGSTVDYETSCRRAELPVLSVGIAGDPIAPPLARSVLLERLPRADKRSVEVPRSEGSTAWRAHFAWARAPGAVVAAIAAWGGGES